MARLEESLQKWSGQFASNQYPAGFASGLAELDLRVAESVPVTEVEYTTPFSVVYTGIFRNGQKILGTTKITGDVMKSTLPPQQELTFTVKERGPNFIKGEYVSSGPSDSGTFLLIPGALSANFPPVQNQGTCTIC